MCLSRGLQIVGALWVMGAWAAAEPASACSIASYLVLGLGGDFSQPHIYTQCAAASRSSLTLPLWTRAGAAVAASAAMLSLLLLLLFSLPLLLLSLPLLLLSLPLLLLGVTVMSCCWVALLRLGPADEPTGDCGGSSAAAAGMLSGVAAVQTAQRETAFNCCSNGMKETATQ